MKTFLILSFLLLPLSALATNRVVNSNATFNTALSATVAGDTITLANGNYGSIYINCTSNAANGNSSNPITIRSQNERQAWIQGDGSTFAFNLTHCSYWNVQGLHVSSADNAGFLGGNGDVLYTEFNDHVTITRNIADHPNRYTNGHGITVHQSTNMTVTENEVYYYHRHGICFGCGSGGSTGYVARNYMNKRGYLGLAGVGKGGGSTGITCYPCSNTILANNIVEGTNLDDPAVGVDTGFDIQARDGGEDQVKWLGNISMNGWFGFLFNVHPPSNDNPKNVTMTNNVTMGGHYGFYPRSPFNVTCTNCSSFDNSVNGFLSNTDSPPGVPPYTLFSTNTLVVRSGAEGFFIDTASGGWSGTFDHNFVDTSGGTAFSLGGLTSTNNTTGASGMGACRIYVPSSATNLKSQGAGGADIGANVLYRYDQTGNLDTSNLLWNVNGWTARGATVTGLNDHAGDSLYDVNQRVNAGVNGCAFPAGYGNAPTIVIAIPATNGTIVFATPTTVSGTSSLP